MSELNLCTPYASVDSARARRELEKAQWDENKLQEVLTSCFFEGSRASANTAVLFILKAIDSSTKAQIIAEVIKSLPTAIPVRTAQALAYLCAFLALNFEERKCRAPLQSFCHATSDIQHVAIQLVVSLLQEAASDNDRRFGDALERSRDFFRELMVSDSAFNNKYIAVGGLIRIGSIKLRGAVRENVVLFVLSITEVKPVSLPQSTAAEEAEFESYIGSELATLTVNHSALASVVRRSLLRSLEYGNIIGIHRLWNEHSSKVLEVLPIVGYDVFIASVILIAASNASDGMLLACLQALKIVKDVLGRLKKSISKVVSNLLLVVCSAIGALALAAGATELAKDAVCIRLAVQNSYKDSASYEEEPIQAIRENAKKSQCPISALLYGLIHNMCLSWNETKKFGEWVEQYFHDLLQADKEQDTTALSGENVSAFQTHVSAGADKDNDYRDDGFGSEPEMKVGLCLTALGLTVLKHEHSGVRYEALKVLGKTCTRRVILFFLPAVMSLMEEEPNGAIISTYMRTLILAPSLVSSRETAVVALNGLLRLMRPEGKKDLSEAYQTGLLALAEASRASPSLATPLLLEEINRLKESFGFIRSDTKAAACSAILVLTKIRPARATAFVPFCALCITKESMEIAPQAAAFCFEAMNVMASEGVLDPVKAVKIVIKSFPSVEDVQPTARKSYLLLLGAVAELSESKKGKPLAEKTIAVLRKCIIDLYPTKPGLKRFSSSETLTWEEIAQAAYSLSRYKPNEILRIHQTEEPSLDQEEEKARLERIEEDCMRFTSNVLVSVTRGAQSAEGFATKALETLLHVIVSHEWKHRSRGKYDPERIAKLRAASDALRRARRNAERSRIDNTENGVDTRNEDDPVERFIRATETLPTGVIKAVCKGCASQDLTRETTDSTREERDGRAICMRALLKADALSPALPWTEYIEEILHHQTADDDVRAAALAVLCAIPDQSFEASQSRASWFGPGSPLFDGSVRTSPNEARQLFIGMMMHFPEEITPQLRQNTELLSSDSILMLIRAIDGLPPASEGFITATKRLVEVLCSGLLPQDDIKYLEKEISRVCLSRCREDVLDELLLPSTDNDFSVKDSSQMHLSCHLMSFRLLRPWVLKALRVGVKMETVISRLGKACSYLSVQQRHTLLFDICGSLHDQVESRNVLLCLASHCLGVASLLPDADNALAAATSICPPRDREVVRSFVEKLCS